MSSSPINTTSPRMRLLWLEASNYRSIGKDVRVHFCDLTALVGPNGAGKSNVLDVARFLREALTLGLEPAISRRLGIARLRRSSPTTPYSVKVSVGVADSTGAEWGYYIQIDGARHGTYVLNYEELWHRPAGAPELREILHVSKGNVTLAPEGLAPRGSAEELVLPSVAGHPMVKPLIDFLRNIRIHSIFPRDLAAPQAVGTRPPLDDTGTNWCAALKALPPQATAELELALARITDEITGVRVDATGGYYVAEFRHEIDGSVRWFNAAQESDGTLRLAGILTGLLQDPPPPLIAIEEPELTINPGLLPLIFDYLEAASDRTQVVITTHSPELLDMLDVDALRVVRRAEGATQVMMVSPEQRILVRDALASPGEILRTGGFTIENEGTSLAQLVGSDQ